MPLTKPMKIAETLPIVTGAEKNTRPLMAMGSLLRAPTIEYVVDEVTRIHQAEQYEIKMAASPEYIMPIIIRLRVSSGKLREKLTLDQSSRSREQITRTGIVRRLL